MTLQAAVQRRPGQVLDSRLKEIKAVVQRQEAMATEGNDHRLLFNAEN